MAASAGLTALTAFPAGEVVADQEPLPAERLYRLPESLADSAAGAVFTMTNGTDPNLGNEVVAFHRLEDGTLSVAGFFPTGGFGAGPAPTSTVFGVPVPANADALGSQDSLILSDPDAMATAFCSQSTPAVTAFPASRWRTTTRTLF